MKFVKKIKNWTLFTRRYLLLGLILTLAFLFFYFNLYDFLTLSALRKYQVDIQAWANAHYFAAVSIYILGFTALIACTIPCATFLTLLGGFLFGMLAVIYALIATTLGGTILFLSIKTAFGARIVAKSSGWIKKMELGFQKNAFNYLLMLRLIPICPCWISNIAAGLLNVPIRIFLIATIIGIFPSTFIYAMAGRGLDKLVNDDQTPYLQIIFTPSIFFPLLGLAILSIIPVIYRDRKKR